MNVLLPIVSEWYQKLHHCQWSSLCLSSTAPRIYQELIRNKGLSFVDTDLQTKEEFLALYEVSSTTEQNITHIACDVLMHLSLFWSLLTGQTYDGAANMAGELQRMQAIVRKARATSAFLLSLWPTLCEPSYTGCLFILYTIKRFSGSGQWSFGVPEHLLAA